MKFLRGEYSFALNSPDKYDLELPLHKSSAHGGTIILWKNKFDKFIDVDPVSSSSFQPIFFHPPEQQSSIQICDYLPTAGREQEFLDDLTELSLTLTRLRTSYPGSPIYL